MAKYLRMRSICCMRTRKSGNKELADLFEKTANTERFEHFAEEAELAGLVGSDAENLRDAIKGESYEIDIMYLEFAGQARAAGDTAAAARFEEIRHDEIGNRDASSVVSPPGVACISWSSSCSGRSQKPSKRITCRAMRSHSRSCCIIL